MFGFLKPEVSGLKNVLNAYFTYKSKHGLLADLNHDQLRDFAYWYYSIRLGPQIVGNRSQIMEKIANERFEYISHSDGKPTIASILQGLLIAEGKEASSTVFFDMRALARLRDKYPPISDEIMGL